MKFEPFIIEKLFEGEDIHVEDLGKFQPIDKPTSIHPGNHEFDPAGRTVAFEFNPEEKDKGFAQFIASQTEQSHQEILDSIKNWVANIKEQLGKGKKVQLKNIGFLVFDFQGNVILEVDESMNFSKKAYGLPRFQQELIRGKDPRAAQEKQKQPAEKQTQAKKPTQKKKTAQKTKSRKKNFWAVPAILIIFIAAAGYYLQSEWQVISNLNLPGKETQKITTEKETVPAPEKNSNKSAARSNGDTTKIKSNGENTNAIAENNEKTTKKTQPAPADNKKQDKITAKPEKSTEAQAGDYLIIAGCFQSYKNAENLVNDLKQEGYPASIQGKTPQGLHRVAYSYFSNKQQALTKLNELTQEGKEGVWLDRY
ncbi:MAG: SPOR domain-containing protein [Bacteroidales bacterium]|nr:SPOR domain-containing protein [Bacteroidales bacterium]MCF8326768.1 SPOR domain-containing protein [Bacteroidales bacterium]